MCLGGNEAVNEGLDGLYGQRLKALPGGCAVLFDEAVHVQAIGVREPVSDLERAHGESSACGHGEDVEAKGGDALVEGGLLALAEGDEHLIDALDELGREGRLELDIARDLGPWL